MPHIRPSSDLRNNYKEIAEICHTEGQPVFITSNGRQDLVVMSNEDYDRLISSYELRRELDKGLADIDANRVAPMEEVFAELEGAIGE